MQTNLEGHVPVHPSRALESMRNSDFDTESAIGEAIDNSLEADADSIRIRINRVDENKEQRGPAKWRGQELAIGDNGHGMSAETLERCLQLGYSDRYNDRSGIGRFGVGVTLGTISQCRRIEVYTKQPEGEWTFTYLDLDEVNQAGEEAILPEPEQKHPPNEYDDLLADDHGTLVIWKKIDRMGVMNEGRIEEIGDWIGRTYRKWTADEKLIDKDGGPPEIQSNQDQREILLYDRDEKVPIDHYDPLFAIPNIPDDPKSELVETIRIEVETDDELTEEGVYPPTDTVKIRMALLPPEFREKNFSNTKKGKKRKISKNKGISILRNGREVYYGSYRSFLDDFPSPDGNSGADWARLGDRYWGAEIEFPATLDTKFRVRNVKTGAKPIQDLADKIHSEMAPTVRTFREKIREQWDKQEEDEREERHEKQQHKEAEDVAKQVPTDDPPADMEADEEEKKRFLEEYLDEELDGHQDPDEILQQVIDEIGPYTIVSSADMHPTGPFIDIEGLGKRTVVYQATRHPFFKTINEQLDFLETAEDIDSIEKYKLVDTAKTLRTSIDLLLIGFAHSYKDSLTLPESTSPSTLMDHQIQEWSQYLKLGIEQFESERGRE